MMVLPYHILQCIRRRTAAAAWLAAFLLFSLPGVAQTLNTNVTGRILDPNGDAIAGASVNLKSKSGGSQRIVASDAQGGFSFDGVADGEYVLTVSQSGFSSVSRDVVLSGAKPHALEIVIQPDSVQMTVTVSGNAPELEGVNGSFKGIGRLNDVHDGVIYAGKKNEVIVLQDLNANTPLNNTRQVFSKVPGINIWENDGSGVQVGIAARGLNPNRSWEFNTRQNGYDISSDVFGYPEAYYTPTLEAVARIDVVRGASSLQYGPQFGGLVNFIMKEAPRDKKFSFESNQTGGAFGLFNTYNRVAGTVGKFSYNGFANYRRADGWRENSQYETTSGFIDLRYAVTEKLKIGFELTTMGYTMQQPGGLTDAQFLENSRQSFRPRNWFNIKWFLPAVKINYDATPDTRINLSVFGLYGERNSVGNISNVVNARGALNVDVPGSPRTVDIDQYRNAGTELRVTHSYSMFGRRNTMATGFRYFEGRTLRQRGVGSGGSDPDFRFTQQPLNRNFNFDTFNTAFFAENIFRITNRWSVTPGFRYDRITTAGSGAPIVGRRSQSRNVPLFGVGTSFQTSENTNVYANWSQAYRPTHFNDVFRIDQSIQVNPDLRDVNGYNVDYGYRGVVGGVFSFDFGGFLLKYRDRIGQVSTFGAQGERIELITNVADSRAMGAETFLELDFLRLFKRDAAASMTLFNTASFTDARYVEGPTRNNRVELAPRWIVRTGVTYSKRKFSATLQNSYVSNQFTNATNTPFSIDGNQGLVPAYNVMDLSGTYRFSERYTFRAGVNNLLDRAYFTRRSTGYPGPGIVSGDGRGAYVSVGMRF
jgi:Fe(3+) dicitrate transport protein